MKIQRKPEVKKLTICSAVLTEYRRVRVTDGQTDIFPQHSLRSAVKMIVANIFAVANVFKSSF